MTAIERKMTPLQRLGIATALQKYASGVVDELRETVDQQMMEDFYENSVDRKQIVLEDAAGERQAKIGTITIRMKKAHWEVADPAVWEPWARENGVIRQELEINQGYRESVKTALDNAGLSGAYRIVETLDNNWTKDLVDTPLCPVWKYTGEQVPGMDYVPERPAGTIVRDCNPETVALACRVLGCSDTFALLEGGDND